ncbi:endonuclease MutS2 [Thermomicrobium sp. CFH 73360]|uniref:endonuclease MutS2 n=1 Tax=Thermomicrobium sp. CFH 73360 TaxID=2951987 RepID=UPI002076EFD4|nr:endonuclease MutS2 [Thermomicrobium sp. CFH 73360]MCM8747101.1 endonuclease MutS2 [Thermomicrobium sp. CFH 73360]
MTSDLLRLLEFDKIRSMLASYCHYSVARERALELTPTADPEQVRYLLQVTREAVRLLSERPGFTVGGFRDLRPLVEAAQRRAALAPTDLRTILDTLEAAQTLRRQFASSDRWAERYPALAEFVDALADLPALRSDLARSIGPRGEILDTASPELAAIRRQLKDAHDRLLERLRRLVAERQDAVQEAYITVREGRYVIPVRADRRSAVPGITHDVSGSGQTLFVEPFEVIELNNRWRELQAAEAHEIERILRVLSGGVAEEAASLLRTVEAGAALDLALAKARFALDLNATEPELVEVTEPANATGHPRLRIRLRRARHPLLDQRTAVPIDIELGERYRILVITGPNTGGKTVALKTVGLLVLMAQAGLFIPAAPGSGLSVFPALFVDIGDEQSIEQNLSTFSSHLRRIVATLKQADALSLVLLDELAAGTDPQEGAALARAILERLLAIGVLGVVTTHYPELKAFAAGTPGLENASVEFDPVTLTPTYRLIIGLPGRSHALQIAHRLGLPETVIERARELLGSGSPQLDLLIAEIQRRLAEAEAQAAAAARARQDAEALRKEAERLLAEAELEKQQALTAARAEVESELRRARELVRKLERLAESSTYPPPQVVESSLRALEEARRRVRSFGAGRNGPSGPAVAVGDRVEIPTLGLEGEVVEVIAESDEVEIRVGQFRVRQPLSAVRRLGARPVEATWQPPYTMVTQTTPTVEPELHLRGLRVEEALVRLDRYLDRAVRAGLPWVRIVHGKGTGALRQAIHDFLRNHPLVERWELAGPYEGGHGVTVVYLRG